MSTISLNLKLKTAIHFNDIEEVKKLLKLSAQKPLSKNPFIFGGYSLLKLAIKLGRKEIAKLLIKKGARVNKRHSNKSFAPLHHAVSQRYFEIVKFLVKKGANVNEPCDRGSITPVIFTVAYSSKFNKCFPTLEMTKYLIRNGADIFPKLKTPTNFLEIACDHKQFEHVRLILKHNADIHSKRLLGSYPIVKAVTSNSVKITSLYLKYGGDANSLLSEQYLDFCLPNNPIARRINSLGNNSSLLHVAIANKNIKMVELLIENGADVHYRTELSKRTPLMLAIEELSPEIVDLLLKSGARINECDEEGMSSLYYLICNPNNLHKRFDLKTLVNHGVEKIKILESLMNAGANVQELDGTHLKFLTMAATYGQSGIINYLVDNNKLKLRLIDDELLQSAKFNIHLLPEDQINDNEYVTRVKFIFIGVEFAVINGILRRHYCGEPIDKNWLKMIRSRPINNYWDYNDRKMAIYRKEREYHSCTKRMWNCKVGDSSINFYRLLVARSNVMVSFGFNKEVRELCLDDYKEQFSPYFFQLKERIDAAVKTSRLLEKSREVIFIILKTVPFDCCSKIITYFSDDDLKILISQFDDILQSFSELN